MIFLAQYEKVPGVSHSILRSEWEKQMGPKTKAFEALVTDPANDKAFDALTHSLRKRLLVERYHMDPNIMVRYTQKYGPIDWRHHAAHSLYWSAKGVEAGEARVTRETKGDFDFVNTDRVRGGRRVELLPSNGALFAWARAAGLSVRGRASARALDPRARRLRRAIRALVEAQIDGRRADRAALATLNERIARAGRPLVCVGDRLARAAICATPDDVLGRVAEDAAELLSTADLRRLRRCGSDRCVLLFYDTSRTHRRRWCSMKTCGNRDKVNRHHARARASRGS